jgi:hypothetical protein
VKRKGGPMFRFSLVLLLTLPLSQLSGQPLKVDLSGTWQLNPAKSQIHSKNTSTVTLTIEQKDRAIHVVRLAKGADGKEVKSDFRCTTDGKECEIDGTKISFWPEGSSLVQLEVCGKVIDQSHLKLDGAGKSLSVEIMHIEPDGEAEKLVFDKI